MNEFPAIRRILREKYFCYSCNAIPGEACSTESGKTTDPHESRWRQHRTNQAKESPPVFPVTLDSLSDALEAEGWGDGFSRSLAERVLTRITEKNT